MKNGVNHHNEKNWQGVFAVPTAVINDFSLLSSLSDRDWRSGFSEAVKVALLKDAGEFERLEQHAGAIARRAEAESQRAIIRSAELHWRHIVEGGDPFEDEIARPLDYGHWSAHRLERLTDGALKHGEAVAIGLGIDAALAVDWVGPPRISNAAFSASCIILGSPWIMPSLMIPARLLWGLSNSGPIWGEP